MVVQNAIIVVIVVDSIREAVAIGVDVIWGKKVLKRMWCSCCLSLLLPLGGISFTPSKRKIFD